MALRNPVLNDDTFSEVTYTGEVPMTVSGVVNKTALLSLLVVISATYTWSLVGRAAGSPVDVAPWMIGGMVIGLILAVVTCFKPMWAPVTSPFYALAQGLAIGGISALYEARSNGIVFQAVLGTFAVLFVMLALYRFKVIRVTDKLRSVIVTATIGVMVMYLASFGMSFFGLQMPIINDPTPLGIAVSVFLIGLAAFNFLLDFDNVDQGVANRAPQALEWYCAFGILVTLIWLYIEMLRLLNKIRR